MFSTSAPPAPSLPKHSTQPNLLEDDRKARLEAFKETVRQLHESNDEIQRQSKAEKRQLQATRTAFRDHVLSPMRVASRPRNDRCHPCAQTENGGLRAAH
jgi:hypothetical protein